jgi:hypothetical protein
MRLFGRKSAGANRCTDCRYYVAIGTRGYCARAVPAGVNVRMLSREGIVRQCTPCPAEMTCSDWEPK